MTEDRRSHETETAQAPSQDEIAQRAYALWVEKGGEDGHGMEDWLQAEAELVGSPSTQTRPQPRSRNSTRDRAKGHEATP